MTKAKPLVELFADVVSPNSWFAFEALTRYRTVWDYNFKLRPLNEQSLFFGPEPEQSNAEKDAKPSPPTLALKRLQEMQEYYSHREFHRYAYYWGIPFNPDMKLGSEISHVETYLTNRFALAAYELLPEDTALRIIRQLWIERWVKLNPLKDPADFLKLSESFGLNKDQAEDVLLKMNTMEMEEKNHDNIKEAVDYGAFGTPWTVLTVNGDKHEFYGWEYLPIMADILDQDYEGPLRELAEPIQ